MNNTKSNNQRSKNAIVLIYVVMIAEIVSLISGYMQYNLLQNIANGVEVSEGTAIANDTREAVIGIIYTILFAISAITFIQWFRRAYYNLHQVTTGLSMTEGWAAGSWFVPIMNLYKPFHIMKELYQKSIEVAGVTNDENRLGSYAANIKWWWALWIASNLIGQFVLRFSLKAESVDELIGSTIASMVVNIIGVPLAILTIKIIKDYTKIEQYMLENHELNKTTTNNILV